MSGRSLRVSFLVTACSAILCLTRLGADDARPAEPPLPESVQSKDQRKQPEHPADLTLDEVLQGWIKKAALIERLDADYSRTTYDKTFNTMKVGTGKLAFDWMGRGFLIPAGAKDFTHQIAMRGSVRYDVKPSSTERWYWTGTHVFKVHDGHVFEQIEKPVDLQHYAERPRAPELPEPNKLTTNARTDRNSWGWFTDWNRAICEPFFLKPFLLGMPIDEMQKRFKISLLNQSESQIRLKFIPIDASIRSNFSQAEIILSPTTYETWAMRFVSPPTGESEDVYVFRNIRINCIPSEPFRDLDRPDLKGYRRRALVGE
jgi:hypothetical protein